MVSSIICSPGVRLMLGLFLIKNDSMSFRVCVFWMCFISSAFLRFGLWLNVCLWLVRDEFLNFKFHNSFYKQISGLSMGSPLSPIFSNLCMELLEYYSIFPKFPNIIWLRYVDDVFALIPKNNNTQHILEFINNLHANIKFTVENPINNSVPFLDILISWTSSSPAFKIYRKPTANPSYIHWYSYHDSSTKTAVLSNLFLRAHKLSDPIFLPDEIKFLEKVFKNLKYPNTNIKKSLKKAKKKYYNTTTQKEKHTNILPTPNLNPHDTKNSLPTTIRTVKSNTINLKSILKPNINTIDDNIGVYTIPCDQCNLKYIGETNDFKRRIY
ncbi:UNVERIFIED_CONTAM: hypothetical protein RMT77_007677 [Armadillidium vulgare]